MREAHPAWLRGARARLYGAAPDANPHARPDLVHDDPDRATERAWRKGWAWADEALLRAVAEGPGGPCRVQIGNKSTVFGNHSAFRYVHRSSMRQERTFEVRDPITGHRVPLTRRQLVRLLALRRSDGDPKRLRRMARTAYLTASHPRGVPRPRVVTMVWDQVGPSVQLRIEHRPDDGSLPVLFESEALTARSVKILLPRLLSEQLV